MNLRDLVRLSLAEDLGPGDITTFPSVPVETAGQGRLLAKQDLVVCGHEVAGIVFEEATALVGGAADYEVLVPDGTTVERGTVIAHVKGSLRTILVGERVALNFFMRLTGIATHVADWSSAAGDSTLRVVDTRKTTPLHRDLEKYAVRAGGGHNHRFGLYDGVLIKDNHITAVGSIGETVRRIRAEVHHLVRIECEVSDLDQLRQALDAGVDAVLLDNMDDALLAESVKLARSIDPRVLLEASGNMNAERIRGIRDLGLDFVSAGGLIHQARWADLSLKVTVG